MNKFILFISLIVLFLFTGGYPSLIRAQDGDRCVGSTSVDGHDINYWCEDMEACDEPYGEGLTSCQLIVDKCVEEGGCAPMLATLQFMGCDKCDEVGKPCFDQLEVKHKECKLAAAAKFNPSYEGFSCKRSIYGICIPGTERYDDEDPKIGETKCHESCQTNYDTCTSECRSADIFNNSNSTNSDDIASCSEKCNALYNSTYESIRHDCFETWWSCGIALYNRSDCKGDACSKEVDDKCGKPYKICLQPAQDAADKCLEGCGVETDQRPSSGMDACYSSCEQTRSSCSQGCREAGEEAVKKSQPSQKPQVGLSSRDFKELAKMMNQLQAAQADLEKIKATNDARWTDKKSKVPDVSTTLQKAPQDVLEVLKRNFENDRDIATVLQDAEELYGVYKGKKFGGYGPVSAAADAGNSVIDFIELTSEGVPVAHASTKAVLDNTAPSAFMIYPPMYALDKIATMPDRIASAFWLEEKKGLRKYTGIIKEYTAPSSFVEKSTDAMVKTGNWTNFGKIYKDMFQDVRDDHTFSGKAWELVKFGYTAVGSIPVVVTLVLKDGVEIVFNGINNAGQLISNVSSWFTYP